MLSFDIDPCLFDLSIHKKVYQRVTAIESAVLGVEFSQHRAVAIHEKGREILESKSCLEKHGTVKDIFRKIQGIARGDLRHKERPIFLRHLLVHDGVVERKMTQSKFLLVFHLDECQICRLLKGRHIGVVQYLLKDIVLCTLRNRNHGLLS